MNRVTLTFDNGPCVDTTPFVLDELSKRNLRAYFCLVGRQLQRSQEHISIAQDTLQQGHLIVNHSLTHTTALGDKPTAQYAYEEINDMHGLMADTIGDWGPRWFRPVGRGGEIGQHIFSEAALVQLEQLAYSTLLWNCVPRDWEDIHGWVKVAHETIASTEHTVIVLHDLDTGAMQHLPRFLDELGDANTEFTLTLPNRCTPLLQGTRAISAEQMGLLSTTPIN